jgi:hypothetical protein
MQDITSFVQPIRQHTAALLVRNSIRNAAVTKLSGRNLQRCGGVGEKIYDFSPTFLQTVANYQTGAENEQTLSHRNGVSIRSTETLAFALCFLFRRSCFRKSAEDPQLCTIKSHDSLCRHTFPYLQLDHEYLLTPCSTVLLEKLTGSKLVKKFPALYKTRRFVTVFTRARHLFLS